MRPPGLHVRLGLHEKSKDLASGYTTLQQIVQTSGFLDSYLRSVGRRREPDALPDEPVPD